MMIEPGLRVEVVGFPALPEPFARILDFDALEREAARDRQGATGRRVKPTEAMSTGPIWILSLRNSSPDNFDTIIIKPTNSKD